MIHVCACVNMSSPPPHPPFSLSLSVTHTHTHTHIQEGELGRGETETSHRDTRRMIPGLGSTMGSQPSTATGSRALTPMGSQPSTATPLGKDVAEWGLHPPNSNGISTPKSATPVGKDIADKPPRQRSSTPLVTVATPSPRQRSSTPLHLGMYVPSSGRWRRRGREGGGGELGRCKT
jgi:hypothetical protein